MAELEFSIEQNLDYDDAIESMFALLDFFEESDDFDEIEWDDEEEVAFLANDDLEVEIALSDGFLDVYVQIYVPDLTRREIRSNLEEDIHEHFGLRDRSARGRRRDWREERSFERTATPTRREERSFERSATPTRRERSDEESAPPRRQSPGRFGRLRTQEATPEEKAERRRARGGARRLHPRSDADSAISKRDSDRPKSRPSALPSGRSEEAAPKEKATTPAAQEKRPLTPPEAKEEPKSVAVTEAKPKPEAESVAEPKEEPKSVAATEAKAKAEEAKAEEAKAEAQEAKAKEAKAAKAAEPKVEEPSEAEEDVAPKDKKLPLRPKPASAPKTASEVAEEVKSGGGMWWLIVLLLLGGGLLAWYLSPLWPLAK